MADYSFLFQMVLRLGQLERGGENGQKKVVVYAEPPPAPNFQDLMVADPPVEYFP